MRHRRADVLRDIELRNASRATTAFCEGNDYLAGYFQNKSNRAATMRAAAEHEAEESGELEEMQPRYRRNRA